MEVTWMIFKRSYCYLDSVQRGIGSHSISVPESVSEKLSVCERALANPSTDALNVAWRSFGFTRGALHMLGVASND